jgi:hypothetical protein
MRGASLAEKGESDGVQIGALERLAIVESGRRDLCGTLAVSIRSSDPNK